MPSLLESAISVAERAGREILKLYGTGSPVTTKPDRSVFTLADRASHELIVQSLSRLEPTLPVLSEESQQIPYETRRNWTRFWLVDPLDGSKEFIKESGQFTVNIALIDGEEPVLGVVHTPVSGVTHLATKKAGAFHRERTGATRPIRCRRADLSRLTVVASKDHAGELVERFLSRLERAEKRSLGSSLKFCLIAEGEADFYPRIVPTMEWDTAAAQCVLEEAGGAVTDLEGRRLTYNRRELRNPSILAYGDASLDWARFFAERTDIEPS